jgi:RimJ/RimL family protein N-acetyltransferase
MILTTERLVLREFEESDWPDVLAYQSDPRYLRYYEWTERTPEEEYFKGRWWDMLLFAILEDEWRALPDAS